MNRKKHTVLTADSGGRLIWRETIAAFSRAGHAVAALSEMTQGTVAKIFSLPAKRSGMESHPSLFFCVNFSGLDKYGEVYGECVRNGLPVAVWCVDNPWNLLSGLRDDFWKDVFLFVTDPSFIPGLKEHGATKVFPLPLATDPAIFARRNTKAAQPAAPVSFVGRSAFPNKKRFFVGQTVPAHLLDAALEATRKGIRPDFFWWREKLGAEKENLWPGSAARRISLGAEGSSLAWRLLCLEAATPAGLSVYGDDGWLEKLPPKAALLPPIDYYTDLAPLYANSPFSLVTMSYLLPRALNQRHFDIWAAGGFALLDSAPGLELFPPELTSPITFTAPEEIPHIIRVFTKDPEGKAALVDKWHKLILAEHTYDTRIQILLKTVYS